MLALCSACSCRPAKDRRADASRSHATPSSAPNAQDSTTRFPKRLREGGLFQVIFALQPPEHDTVASSTKPAGTPPTQIGCQLHVLKSAKGKVFFAVDIGDARRRNAWPKTKTHWRRPAHFQVSDAPSADLWLEFHSTLHNAAPVRVRATPGTTPKLVLLPAPLPPTWAFSCILRKGKSVAVAVDTIVERAQPKLAGKRTLRAPLPNAAQLRDWLQQRCR